MSKSRKATVTKKHARHANTIAAAQGDEGMPPEALASILAGLDNAPQDSDDEDADEGDFA